MVWSHLVDSFEAEPFDNEVEKLQLKSERRTSEIASNLAFENKKWFTNPTFLTTI